MRRIGEDRVTLARLGTLRIWLARAEQEWAFAYEFGESKDLMDIAQVPEDVVPSHLEWSDMVFGEAPRDYSFKAIVPERPLVVKTGRPVSIPPGQKGVFYAKFPIMVAMTLNVGKKEVILGKILSESLCDTWFGEVIAGEYCYALPEPAALDVESLHAQPNEVVCPIEVDNNSSSTVTLKKFCLRPDQLTVFSGGSHLWSSRVKVKCEDLFKSSSVSYSTGQPDTEENLVEIIKPNKREETGLQRLGLSSSFGGDLVLEN